MGLLAYIAKQSITKSLNWLKESKIAIIVEGC